LHRVSTGTWRGRNDADRGIARPPFQLVGPRQYFGGVQFTRYILEDLAITLAMDAHLMSESPYSAELLRLGNVEVDGLALPIGVRWHPLKGEHQQQVKLFIGGAVGPIIAAMNKYSFASPSETRVLPETHHTTIGGRIGGGVDIHLARSFSVEVGVDYNAMKTLSRSVGPVGFGFEQAKTFAGPQVIIAAGWLFGKGHASKETP
jgi:hypothetical protein